MISISLPVFVWVVFVICALIGARVVYLADVTPMGRTLQRLALGLAMASMLALFFLPSPDAIYVNEKCDYQGWWIYLQWYCW